MLSVHQEGLKDNCQKVFCHLTPSQSILETFKVKRGWWPPHAVWNRVKVCTVDTRFSEDYESRGKNH